MFCFILVVNLNNDYSCCHPPGRHPTCPWSFRTPPPASSCIPHGSRQTHPWFFWAPPNPPVVLPGTAPCALGPSGRRPTQPYLVLVGVNQRTLGLGPSVRRPVRPWSPRVRPHTHLLSTSKRRPTPRNVVDARPRQRSLRKNSTVATEEGKLIHMYEIWIEKGKKQKKKSHHFHTAEPLSYPLLIAASPLLVRSQLNRRPGNGGG